MPMDIVPDTYMARATLPNRTSGTFFVFSYKYTDEDMRAGLTHEDCMMREFDEFYITVIKPLFEVELEYEWDTTTEEPRTKTIPQKKRVWRDV